MDAEDRTWKNKKDKHIICPKLMDQEKDVDVFLMTQILLTLNQYFFPYLKCQMSYVSDK